MKIFVFNSDSKEPVLTYQIAFDYPYLLYNLLDISYDGSIILIANDREAIIIDTTIPGIRWRGDLDGIPDNNDINIATISDDGSIMIGQYRDNRHCLKAFKWNEAENDYEELWHQNFVLNDWLICMTTHTLEVSNDGSTLMVSVKSFDGLQTKLFTFNVESGDLLWEHHTIVTGEYGIDIFDICFSEDGSKGIAAYFDDEYGVNPEIKVFQRENSTLIFIIDALATCKKVDITPDGKLAVASGDLAPAWYISFGTILYSIDLDINNVRSEKPSISDPSSGKAIEEYEYVFLVIDPDGDDVFSLLTGVMVMLKSG